MADDINVAITEESIAVTISDGVTWDGISGKPTAVAESSFIVSDATPFSWLVKTLAQVKTILGLGSAAYTAVTDYVTHALATAANDFIVASGSGAFVKKTLAETKALILIPEAIQTPAFADPLALDGTLYKSFKVTVSANTTVNLTGVVDGDAGSIELIISGAGGYTITMGTMFTKKLGSTSIVATTAADNFISWMKSGADILYTIIQKV
ncbi:MAG TPA: hypothetical protein VI911_00660 [Patescibacteria group bacterium]|nr:hypothetical protein [Patescibacteria group bacterium]